MDRSPPDFATGFYSGLGSNHGDCVVALLQTLNIDEAALKKLSGKSQRIMSFQKKMLWSTLYIDTLVWVKQENCTMKKSLVSPKKSEVNITQMKWLCSIAVSINDKGKQKIVQ